MKKFSYRFRSIMVNNVEKIIPGTSRTTMELDMDEKSIEQHSIELTFSEILHDKSWTINFMLAVMLTSGISGLIFGIAYVMAGRFMTQESWTGLIRILIILSVFLLIIIWLFLSFRNSVANKKREFVEKTRGKGNWKIIDESKWDDFYRLLMIAKKKK
jgi:hypothetical protein